MKFSVLVRGRTVLLTVDKLQGFLFKIIMRLKRRKFCECGCGERTKRGRKNPFNDFIRGHAGHKKGKIMSPNKGKTYEEIYGKKKGNEIRIKNSLSHGGTGIIKNLISVECTCGCGQKTTSGRKYLHGHNKYCINGKRTQPEIIKRKISKGLTESWKNMSEKERSERIRKSLICSSPNKSEIKLKNILNELCPREWDFVGDGQIIIGGKCPDFINVNGQKKLIELYGDYWHQGENTRTRKRIFKKYGFDTLIIWEKELKNISRLEKKIDNFTRGFYD